MATSADAQTLFWLNQHWKENKEANNKIILSNRNFIFLTYKLFMEKEMSYTEF